ncbi:MAG TPA: HAMP domain-containing sensor histidine kinase [Jatrophihabitans sp.]|nr:HAMP domain-containing sensor histidine kinase [Jatrophihabitans sp.]
MQLTARRRIVVAILISWPLGYFYLDWATYVGIELVRYYRSGYTTCDGSWRSYFNSCDATSYSPTIAWVELIAATAVVVALGLLVARWAIRPVREISDVVNRFGPTSLGLRLRAEGPHDETRRLSDAIDAMLDRLAEGYEAQRRFASNASHELRTPLATQRALIEVSLSSALTPEQLDLLSRQLLATNERNEKLVDGLLTLAETERGLMANTPLRLDRIVSDVLDTLRPMAKERELELSAGLAPATVIGEFALLDRLASNLVHNAIKYNQPGGSVIVNVTRDGILSVVNTGPVVPPEQVAGLFEPFRRMTGERLDHGGGVGLGLTIARSIVAAHGGAIDARADPDGGLVIQVRLPVG